jgi:hypothetical protein
MDASFALPLLEAILSARFALNSERSKASCCQSGNVSLTFPGCLNNASSHDLVHDLRLPLIMEFSTSSIEGLAEQIGGSIVEHDTAFSYKRSDRRHQTSIGF